MNYKLTEFRTDRITNCKVQCEQIRQYPENITLSIREQDSVLFPKDMENA